MKFHNIAALAATVALVSACEVNVRNDTAAETNQPTAQQQRDAQLAQMRDQARQELNQLRIVVDKSDRQVQLFNGDQLLRTEQVAIGQEEHATPTGSWRIEQVDLNPEWIPPDSDWARNETRKAPGDPENPMGRARLIYNPPYSIHGTDEQDSLGRKASHGSIRVANSVVLELAQMVIKAGGAWEGDQWFQERINNRSREFQIRLDNPIPIEVRD
ncbi:MAG TPA: L,D-transpeptidase [Sphingomicrobium sp.]|nr:L,D-transpeptidase [Sphingomicrobium sp.]